MKERAIWPVRTKQRAMQTDDSGESRAMDARDADQETTRLYT